MTDEHGDLGPSDQRWDRMARHETETQRLDRNWSSLLQELRVAQTGVQLLTGFLLTLPFQQRFSTLDDQSQTVYLATVGFSVASTILLIAPVGMHRILFRQRRMPLIVAAAHRCAFYGLLLLGIALTGVTELIFGTVAGQVAGWVAGGIGLAGFCTFWVLVPLAMQNSRNSDTARAQ
ncbi:DUF6328 family protein [Mycolicibacterium mucogenicum]|uniref:Sodium:proton antiporter n=1 Tax=Mycolicibacterium mucogenicum DSM 44124 TaxID=1226753 RepID=A0A8H2JBT7_MYCMU|nr:DUF6328 family protein [Mycolicibacterium mucogenicum]KAB7758294.1 membrane protein [Mycolicibacterium mucogenicum DSM 44124]QPG71723.1 hypothetical protein C1S78_012755 [Mycolicibacterium mucogenicum DSM 44124]